MFPIFIGKIEPALNNKPQITLSNAEHNFWQSTGLRYIQIWLGHSSIKATMIYTHITNKAINRIHSPLDRLILNTEIKKDEKNDKKV